MPVAAGKPAVRSSVGDLFTPEGKAQSLRVGSSQENPFGDLQKSVSAKSKGDLFESFKSRKSLREIQAEKQKQRELEDQMYPGLAQQLIRSPLRNREARLLGTKAESP